MLTTKPSYYDAFRCLAGSCPDSCCQEWAVRVDEASAKYYRSLPGELGDRLRQVLRTEEDETVMTIEDGRCPMWRSDGLCRIQAELGEEALCHTCRTFPRLPHEYDGFRELQLELSCPEAARLILCSPAAPRIVEGDWEAPDRELSLLLEARNQALDILSDAAYSVSEAMTLVLQLGFRTHVLLQEEDAPAFDPQAALETAREMALPGDISALAAVYADLEILTPRWAELLDTAREQPLNSLCRPLLRYFVERWWLQSINDLDLYCRVKFCLISCILINSLAGDFRENAQLYSKEIENDDDNVDALLDGAYMESAFSDRCLLGLLGNS